jgi:tetratricopeptide (TPR) repeat protein
MPNDAIDGRAASTKAGAPVEPKTFASGRFVVQRLLGEGGQKTVYLARDTELERDVAIAVIKTHGLDEAAIARVRREAQTLAGLGAQPHIVTMYDIGQEQGPDGRPAPYLVCEYIAGGDLERELRRAGGPLPLERVYAIGLDLCQALEVAHSRGILHRDLKPGNVWLTEEGRAKLGDFGLAMALGQSRLTEAGSIMGTASYMPPEQALGSEADARGDLYALGCVLYELVTGRPPFLGGDTIAVISQHINTAPIAPSWHRADLPRALDALIERLLAKTPDARPASAEAVADELRRIAERGSEELSVAPPVTTTLRGLEWGHFVGRRDEMDQLKTALENGLSGHGSLVMLVGEPGIGKTRLAEEFSVYATLRGAQVLTGRCYEGEVALPYRPFVEAFRQYVRNRPDLALRDELGEGAPEIAKLVSEVRQRFPDIPEAPALEAEAERLRLFESAATFARNAAQAQPLVFFLDDIHWADKPSLLLMRYLTRALANERVLLLAAYRDIELDRAHPLAEVLATIRREQRYERVRLRGLSQDDVLALLNIMESSEETAPGRGLLAGALYSETEGNPFFIREVLNHLIEEGKIVHEGGHWVGRVASVSELGIPEGVREVIGRRLSRLSDGCNRMLTCASTMTGGCTWDELKAITGEPEAALLDLLDEVLGAQLLGERKDSPGVYDFTHALIRQTLYDELSTPRRVLLHRQIGKALEELYAAHIEAHLGELAHHFYQAAPGGDVDKAIDYASRAGDQAMAQYAWEEAADHYQRALQALELGATPDEAQRCELLLGLGEAQHNAGQEQAAAESYRKAAAVARELKDPDWLARAAIGFEMASYEIFGNTDLRKEALALLDEALAALGDEESVLRVRALVRRLRPRAALAIGTGDVFRTGGFGSYAGIKDPIIEEEARAALEQAERLGDRSLVADALYLLEAIITRPGSTIERLTIGRRALDLAKAEGSPLPPETDYLLRTGYLRTLVEMGELASVPQQLDEMARLAAERRVLAASWNGVAGHAMLAIAEGHFSEAEEAVRRALAVGQETGYPDAGTAYGAQLYALRWLQGRLSEMETLFRQAGEQSPNVAVYAAGLALIFTECDRLDDGREVFDRIAAHPFADIDEDFLWMATMVCLADVCTALNDANRAEALYTLLLPHARLNVAIAFVLSAGSASRSLGQLASVLERWEDAERHFKDAIEMNTRMGFRPWVAMTQLNYGQMLLARDSAGDRERALAPLDEALATAQELDMKKLVEDALALKQRAQGVAPSSEASGA